MSASDPILNFEISAPRIKADQTLQLHAENVWARLLAQPLFKNGVRAVGLARKTHYPAGLSQGRMKHHLVLLMVQGELNIMFGKLRTVLKPGMISFCPAGERYSRHNRSENTCWIYFELADDPIWAPLKNKGPYKRICTWGDQIVLLVCNLINARRDQTVTARLNALEDAHFLGDLLRRERRMAISRKPNRRTEAIQQLAMEIHHAPQKNWTVALMSQKTEIPPRTLNRLFKNNLGMGPIDLVIKNRMDLASSLLISTDDTIETIARELGYKSVYSFSNLFQRHVGMRPGKFRKECQS